MAQHFRHFWGPQKTARFNFQWDAIRHDSFVVITASEGSPRQEGLFFDPSAPERFVGSAHFQVSSVAPHDGGVTFWVIIGDAKALLSGFFNWVGRPSESVDRYHRVRPRGTVGAE